MRGIQTFEIVLAVMLALGPGAGRTLAQDETPPQPSGREVARRVIQVRSLDVRQLVALFSSGWNVNMRMSPEMGIVTVTGAPDAVEAVAQQIARLDAPENSVALTAGDIEVVAYVVGGLAEGEGDASFPAAIGGVVNNLRGVFPYTGYHLLETIQTRVNTSAKTEVSGQLATFDAVRRWAEYSLEFRVEAVTAQAILLSGLQFRSGWPVAANPDSANFHIASVNITTDVRLQPNEPAVIGKSSTLGEIRGVFLVLSARPAR